MKRNVQQEVAREAGKSFLSVVKDYAEAGHSKTETAELLGYSSASPFLRLVRDQGIGHWFPPPQQGIKAKQARAARRGVDTLGLKRNRELIQYPKVSYQGILDTWAGHARRLGLSARTVYKRKSVRPGDLDYIFHKGSWVRPPSNAGHHWRKLSMRRER